MYSALTKRASICFFGLLKTLNALKTRAQNICFRYCINDPDFRGTCYSEPWPPSIYRMRSGTVASFPLINILLKTWLSDLTMLGIGSA